MVGWTVCPSFGRTVGRRRQTDGTVCRQSFFFFDGEGGDNEGEFYFELVVIESLVDYVWHRQKRSNQLVVLHFQQSGSAE